MKLSDLKSHDEVHRQRYDTDPEYAAEIDRTATTSKLSAIIVDFRARRNLSQTAFGAMLGWKQPQVARLERGDYMPSVATLQRLARHGVLSIQVNASGTTVRPQTRKTVAKKAQKRSAAKTTGRAAAGRGATRTPAKSARTSSRSVPAK